MTTYLRQIIIIFRIINELSCGLLTLFSLFYTMIKMPKVNFCLKFIIFNLYSCDL